MSAASPSILADESVPWTLGDILKAMVSAATIVVGLLLITNLVFLALGVGRGGRYVAGLFAGAVVELALLGVAWRFSLWKYKRPWGELGFRRFDLVGLVLAGVVLFLGLVVNLAYVALISLAGLKELLPPPLLPGLSEVGLAQAGTALLAVVASPLAEEAFFRGFVFAGLRRRFGLGWGIGASSLLFALSHFQAGVLIPVLALGAMLAVLYQATRSIWPAIVVHSLYNGLALRLALG